MKLVVILISTAAGFSHAEVTLLQTHSNGGGGQVSGGSSVTAQVSIGDVLAGPISRVTTGGVQHKANFIGQLYDFVQLIVEADPEKVNEGETRQLSAAVVLDDETLLVPDNTEVQWSILSGPLVEISDAGVVSADRTFQDTSATVRGEFREQEATLSLLVLETEDDNFGAYAGDGLGDAWQVSFFGLPPNADASPGANPDGDVHDNRFEFLTGYDPTDPSDFFTFSVVSLAGPKATLELSKIVPGTRYRIERSRDLATTDPWTEFLNLTTAAEVTNRQVTDTNASGAHWFYRIGVEEE